MSQFHGATVLIACLPERLVLRSSGLEWPGGHDADLETPNDAGLCTFGADPDGGFDRSLVRLYEAADRPAFVAGLFVYPTPESSANDTHAGREDLEARRNRDGSIHASWTIGEARFAAIIRDGSVTQGHMVIDDRLERQASYEYGPRNAAPAIRGSIAV